MKNKNIKRVFAVVLTIAMIITTVPMYVFATETTEFAGGSGTADDPYLISTKNHLNNVRNYQSAYYKMTADIIFTDSDFEEGGDFFNDGKGWTPISDFRGVFDGNGHTIKNIQITILSSSKHINAGLFANNNGKVTSLGVVDGNTFINITNSAYVGGIVGYNYGEIESCYNSGTINVVSTDTTDVGGIAGYNKGTIKNCYNTGLVSGGNNTSSYAAAGGIAGWNSNEVTTSYNIGSISSTDYPVGAISGFNDANMYNCYFLDNMTNSAGNGNRAGATKLTIDHMKAQKTFGGFDFDNVWTMAGDTDYPYPELKNVPMDFTKEFIGIGVHTLPNKTEYYSEIEDFNVDGGKIKVIYNDGTYEVVDMTSDMVTGYDKNKVGSQTLTVTYRGKTTTFNVTCMALVYDFKMTTDEQITLEYQAKTAFDFVLSDTTVAYITNVSSSVISWGSTVEMYSSATIVPLKPGYVVVKVVDKSGNLLTQSLIWIEEGSHKMQLAGVIEEATCEKDGKEIYACEFCGATEKRVAYAKGHSYGAWNTTKQETCTEDGSRYHVCARCTHKETETVLATGHTVVIDEEVEATCEVPGKTEGSHCSKCNIVIKEQTNIEPLGHSFSEWTVSKPATETESGEMERVCSNCGMIQVTDIVVERVIGDANSDGKITAIDARWILQYVAGVKEDIDLLSSDVNGDGRVTAIDARWTLQMVAGVR